MVTIQPAAEERAAGKLTADHLALAVRALREDGFLALADAVDPAHLALLRPRMLEDVAAILARPDAPYNFNAGNVQQDPPPFPPYLFRDILVNDLVIQVTKAVLGDGVKNGFYSGNTALPGDSRQPVHPDVAQLWPGLERATPAFGLVVNVPVVDMAPENGSTEVWPGTHTDTTYSLADGSVRVAEDLLARRRNVRPPEQPSVRAGGVIIRDIRLWHAGMPNHTQTPRPMIAMIHWCGWWQSETVTFAKGSEPYLEHPDLATVARFVEGPVPYLAHNKAYMEPSG